jgi:hypothetical protein
MTSDGEMTKKNKVVDLEGQKNFVYNNLFIKIMYSKKICLTFSHFEFSFSLDFGWRNDRNQSYSTWWYADIYNFFVKTFFI